MATANSEFKNDTALITSKQKNYPEKLTNNAELIRALTPIAIAFIGGVIGMSALFIADDNNKLTAAMGLAGTALAGASGLAQQSGQNE